MKPYQPRHRAGAGHSNKSLVGRRHQCPRKSHALLLVTVENRRIRSPSDHRRQLPRQVHRVADPRIHPLSAHRAVDVRRIPQQERAPLRKWSATR